MLYKTPFDFYGFFKQLEARGSKQQTAADALLQKIESNQKSIDQVIELILSSYPGECRMFYDFSFSFWGIHHNNISVDKFNNTENPKSQIESRLKNSIIKYEPRLTNVAVDIHISPTSIASQDHVSDYSIYINITAKYKANLRETYQKQVVFSAGTMKKKH